MSETTNETCDAKASLAAPAGSAWIDCNDWLPEEPGEYLVSRQCRPNGWVCQFLPCGEWLVHPDYPVTHWMPMPKAPNKKGQP